MTSLIARSEVERSGVVNKQAAMIYGELADSPMTISELASRLGMEAGRVSARMSDLRKAGLVLDGEKYRKRKCKVTGRLAIEWSLPGSDQLSLI